MMKISDYIAQKLFENNIKNIFMVTGGAAMHLNDSLGSHPKLNYTCFYHEQAASMAAESYYRMSGNLAVLNVTAGPGAINALNGVFGAYTDSMGMIIISGQAKRETMSSNYDLHLRQLGDQENDITYMVRKITKKTLLVKNKIDFGVEQFSMRMYFPSKMNQILVDNGFHILHQWGDYYRSPLGEGSKLQIYDVCLA